MRLLNGPAVSLLSPSAAGVIGTPALRADTTVASGARSTLTIGKPTGTADGDLLVAAIIVDSADTVTAPAGWNLIATTLYSASAKHTKTYWKVASSEGASWDWTIGASVGNNGWVGAYTGCKITNVAAELVSSSNPNQAGVTNVVASAVTTTAVNSLLIGVWFCAGARTWNTVPADMTNESTASGPSTLIADSVQAEVGSSGTKTAVLSSAAAAAAQLLAFRALGT